MGQERVKQRKRVKSKKKQWQNCKIVHHVRLALVEPQRGTGELSPLAARQAGAKPVTQAGVDFSGVADRREKSAAAQGKGAVSGLDFSTAVRPGSKDGSEGAASTPTVVTGGQPSLSDPNRPGRLQRTQDYFKNIAAKVPVAAGQLATAAQQQAQQTIANIKRDLKNPDLERVNNKLEMRLISYLIHYQVHSAKGTSQDMQLTK